MKVSGLIIFAMSLLVSHTAMAASQKIIPTINHRNGVLIANHATDLYDITERLTKKERVNNVIESTKDYRDI